MVWNMYLDPSKGAIILRHDKQHWEILLYLWQYSSAKRACQLQDIIGKAYTQDFIK